jgi:hypothetical protein
MGELHAKSEPLLRPGKLFSLLDLMGARLECDQCGNWESLPALDEKEAKRLSRQSGWRRRRGKDLCPACVVSLPPTGTKRGA